MRNRFLTLTIAMAFILSGCSATTSEHFNLGFGTPDVVSVDEFTYIMGNNSAQQILVSDKDRIEVIVDSLTDLPGAAMAQASDIDPNALVRGYRFQLIDGVKEISVVQVSDQTFYLFTGGKWFATSSGSKFEIPTDGRPVPTASAPKVAL